ncbi:MAG: polysaccharide deacetylase family protein [Eubacteriales bacterium]|nr:polysaccharide deacetylase family protein [Eubacteriales bacterium]
MDKKVLRERVRKKQQQIRRRKMMKMGACVIAVILVIVFIIRGIFIPVVNRLSGREVEKPAQVQAETDQKTENSGNETDAAGTTTVTTTVNTAARYPLKNDLAKASQMSIGWNENANGKWYQNADGTYYAGGMQEIDGSKYYFDENGYIQTGWVSVGFDDYYFNDDGTYDPNTHKPRIALTFDDGPGEYTDELLDCLEQNNAHATFFMLGQNVGSWQSTVQRMADIGCELGNHSWDHPSQTLLNMSMDDVLAEFQKTDDALKEACGQISTVARAPYGAANQDIFDAVQKPFFMWSLDTEDWRLMDATADYNAVMNGDLTDGTIILMHDIHEPSVQAALKLIPDLTAQGYKLMTVSELAAAKNVTLQNASYSQFWDSQLQAGTIPGYNGNSDSASADGSSDVSDGSDSSSDSTDVSDGSSSDSSDDGSADNSSGDEDYESDDSGSDDSGYDDSSGSDDSSGEDDSGGYYDEDSSGDDSYDTY